MTLRADTGVAPAGDPGVDRPRGVGFAFQRGVCVGRYVVLEAIGSGGMGNVYAAYDPELDRKVALKVLRADLLISEQREEAQSRLLREAQATARLTHPNVVAVYDTGAVGERLFIAMELVEGRTLAEWLAEAPRSWREILDVFEQAGRGLAAAHRVGLVHRDFKPGNVMVCDDGRVRVVDFGLARAAGQGRGPRHRAAEIDELASGYRAADSAWSDPLTIAGKALGTPAYMAPEQQAGTAADARADQFSYCLALYEALCGELPFRRDTAAEAIACILHLSSHRSDCPFVPINCAAIPADLLEAELFGIGKGVATGVAERKGKFEIADGGTLFLDEVGDMSADLQAKLLRALQEREIQPVCGSPRPIDVGIVAATNTELSRRMKTGAFRSDLYYRLAGFVLTVPPLRERQEDIPVLAEHFLRRGAREAGKSIHGMTLGALRGLLERPWSGNIRELIHEVFRLVYLCPDHQAIDSALLLSAAAPPGVAAEGLNGW